MSSHPEESFFLLARSMNALWGVLDACVAFACSCVCHALHGCCSLSFDWNVRLPTGTLAKAARYA
jgi:hypothetical protein